MLLPYTAGVYYGPAACAMVVEDSIGQKESIEIRGDLRVGADAQGLGEVHYMRPIRLRGFPMDSQGLGEIHAFQPRMRARIALDVAISQLSQDDVVGALQTMPVSESMSFAEFCTAMIAYMENGGSAPTPEQNAAAILVASQTTPIHANVREVNDAPISGSGIPPTFDEDGNMTDPGDPWVPI